MPAQWKKVELLLDPRAHLRPEDECFYARDYLPGAGYQGGEANQLINNFKKHPRFRGQTPWEYRNTAVKQFARELSEVLPKDSMVTWVPSSKPVDGPDYDRRFEDLFNNLRTLRADLSLSCIFSWNCELEASHLGGTRDPLILQHKITRCATTIPNGIISIVDDVLTTGGHFSTCKRNLAADFPTKRIMGFFWAKTQFPSPFPFEMP
ncbi:MAG TPA: hypothetical protein VJ385_01025 [Fibrobacteria bacterium]|nr:hypothetical protein [Fibrobacteria bacterium]